MKPSILPITTGLCLLLFACTDNIDLGSRGELGGDPNATGGMANTGGNRSTLSQGTKTTTRGGGTGFAAVCGDGILQLPESCDDGNNLSGDGCTGTCISESGSGCGGARGTSVCQSTCGDGILTGAEECDDGNRIGSDGCADNCVVEAGWDCMLDCAVAATNGRCPTSCERQAVCGNGIVEPGESCDEGLVNGEPGHCYVNCTLPGACGDGILQPGESCDDGNAMSADGCSADCKSLEPGWQCAAAGTPCFPSICGNGVVEYGEDCDEGPMNGTPGHCTSACKLGEHCGDGIVQEWEQCDFGSERGHTECTNCQLANGFCGNGIVEASEQCDLGGKNGDSECSIDCLLASGICGNGIVEGAEQCDDGVNEGSYGGCGPDCALGPKCGDGKVNVPFEQCDLGGSNGTSGCSTACKTMQ